ncbi:MAG: nucleotide sugar dehydrogenase [Chloroflexi bacterium]|nr:nucleotide sugar dehydrogenase [Chloroflexota bacterium]
MTTDLLSSRISSRTARVAVIGLGYVGLPLAVAFARAGFPVVGVDVDEKKVAALNAGRSYIGDVSDEDLRPHVASGRLRVTTDYDALREADAIFICVPTPYDAQRAPDLSFIRAAAEGIRPRLRPGHLVVLQSTTYPGTTEEVVQPILEASGLRAGVDFYLAFSPERIDPGNKQWSAYNTPKVVGGVDPESTRLACDLLGQMGAPVHPVSSPRAAEMTKLLENIFRSVNIALVNELALLAERMGIDFWEVIEAAKTKPFGFMPFYPGAGVGGHCLAPGEYITIRGENGCEILPIQSCFERVSGRSEIHGVILAQPSSHLEILSFNPQTGETCFRPLRYISARRYEGAMVEVLTADGRRLKVTDGHPMLVWDKEEICIRRADALKAGDDLLVAKGLPVKLEAYASGRRKRMPVTQSEDHGFFATVKVREVNPAPPVDMVYSVEVDDFHTFVTSYGIVVHNCIPVDPYYLSWKAREYDFYTKFIELAAEVNQAMPYHAVDLVAEALSQDGLPLKGARVLVLGVAFKPDVDDPRNSPAERVIELLLARGAEVRYHDPYIPHFTVGGDVFYRPNCTLDSVPLTDEELASADCVVIVTGHRSVDYARVVQKARRVVDCCNATRGTPPDRRVVRLGAPFPR